MNYSDQYELIEALLRSKSFEQLSEQERTLVLQSMDSTAYNQQRAILLSANEIQSDAVPDARAFESVMAGVQNQKVKTALDFSWFQSLINKRIPIWQVGLATMIIGAAFFQFFQNNSNQQHQQTPFVQIRDTIYKEVIMPLTSPQPHAAFAISNRMADSNYNLYLAYLKNNEPADIYFEKPLQLSPIEFKERNGIWRDSQGLRRIDSL